MEPKTLGEPVNNSYLVWFDQLQSLTSIALDDVQWTGRWYDGYTPAEALAEGPDEEED